MVVFFDIDGTVIDNETQIIPPSAIRAVEALGKKGHLAVVNTGRPYAHIDPRIRNMAFGGWVCGCGMEIMAEGKWLVRRTPGAQVCAAVREAIRECRMQVLYEAREGAVYTEPGLDTHPNVVEECRQMAAKGFHVAPIDTLDVPEFMKFVTFDGKDSRREEFIRRVSPWFDIIDRGGTMLELVLKGCSKAGGMTELLQSLGLDRNDTMAIGDSTNDLPMFSIARIGVCLGGGMQELKDRADFVTAAVLDDGIEKALKHYGLI